MKPECCKLAGACVSPRAPGEKRKKQPNGETLKTVRHFVGVSSSSLRQPTDFLAQQFEEVSVDVQFNDPKSELGQMFFIKISVKTGAEMKRSKVSEANEWRGEDELTS